MADDQTDADFFDKLVDDDAAPAPAPANSALARDVSVLSLADDDPPTLPPAPESAPPEGGSPGSAKAGAGLHTTVKQVQWASFGGGPDDGADPFAELSGAAGDDSFFGTQTLETSAGTSDHDLFGANHQSLAPPVTDQDLFGGTSSSNQNVDGQLQRTGSGAVDFTDPKYLEAMYPGWKYDEATQQWYQVDTSNTIGNAAQLVDNTSQNLQQQQQLDASYLQNSVHAGLETIAEEGTATAGVSSWGQGGASEYPPNMLFYAEYPGWYFDTNTQQWQSLESYQQSVAQAATSPAASDGFAGAGYSVAQYTDDSYASSFSKQSQWQPDSLGNTMQPDVLGGNSLLGCSYSSNQQAENQIGWQANSESLQSSINYKPHADTFVPSTGQHTGSEGNHATYEGFRGNHSSYKGYEHSTSQEVGYKGFASSTGFQTGHKELQPPIDHQAGHMAHEPSTRVGYGNSNGPKDFVPKESMYKTQTHAVSSAHTYVPNNYWGTQTAMDFAQQQQIGTNAPSQQFGFSPHEQRSSAGRPPHAVVTFGFGGKLLVLKESSSMTANFDSGNQVQ